MVRSGCAAANNTGTGGGGQPKQRGGVRIPPCRALQPSHRPQFRRGDPRSVGDRVRRAGTRQGRTRCDGKRRTVGSECASLGSSHIKSMGNIGESGSRDVDRAVADHLERDMTPTRRLHIPGLGQISHARSRAASRPSRKPTPRDRRTLKRANPRATPSGCAGVRPFLCGPARPLQRALPRPPLPRQNARSGAVARVAFGRGFVGMACG